MGSGSPHQRLTFLLFGLVGGFPFGFMVRAGIELVRLWTRSLSDSPAVTPLDAYRAEWRFNFVVRLTIEPAEALVYSILYMCYGALYGMLMNAITTGHPEGKFWIMIGIGIGLVLVVGKALALGLGPAAKLKIAEASLLLRGHGRIRFMPLLETALQRQVLRQAGAVYQFRHAALQDHLAARMAEQEQR